MNKKLNELEGQIGYRFSDRQLLTRAMTHSLSLIHIEMCIRDRPTRGTESVSAAGILRNGLRLSAA